MAIIWLILAVTVAGCATLGALRAAARSFGALAGGLALLLAAAGACYLIGDAKTGGYLAGIVGALFCLLLLIAAGALALGAAGRWLWDRWKPSEPRPRPAGNWDLWLIGVFAALAVGLSAAE